MNGTVSPLQESLFLIMSLNKGRGMLNILGRKHGKKFGKINWLPNEPYCMHNDAFVNTRVVVTGDKSSCLFLPVAFWGAADP